MECRKHNGFIVQWFAPHTECPVCKLIADYELQKKKRKKKRQNNKKYSEDSIEFQIAKTLLDLILKRKPDFRKPNLQSWAKYVDMMIRLDKRSPDKIFQVLEWCQKDCFWQNNILSTLKLRKHFDRLEMTMAKSKSKIKLLPIRGKTCSITGCGLPAVYKDGTGAYDHYYCSEHLPERVKRLYE